MKKIKCLIIIIIICAIVFVITQFLKNENNNSEDNTQNITTIQQNSEKETKKDDLNNTENNITDNVTEDKKVTSGEELMGTAKTISARGWAGASTNIIGIKNGILYYYNLSTGEFYEFAEGVTDIYYQSEESEEITAKKGENFKEIKSAPNFLIYE